MQEKNFTKKRLLLNSFSGVTCQIVTAVVGLVLLRINLHFLGKELYGISALAISFVAMLNYLSAGMGPTLVRFFARASSNGSKRDFNECLATSFYLLLTLSFVGCVVCCLCTDSFVKFYAIPESYAADTKFLLNCLGASFLFGLLSIVYNGVLSGINRYDFVNNSTALLSVLKLFLVVLLYRYWSSSLKSLGIAILSYSSASFVALTLASLKELGVEVVPKIRFFSPRRIVRLLSFSLVMMCYTSSIGATFQLTTMTAGKISLVAAGVVATTISVVLNVEGLLARGVNTLTTVASRDDAETGGKRLGKISLVASYGLALFATASWLGTLCFGRELLTLWLGASMAESVLPILLILLPVCWFGQRANVYLLLGARNIGGAAGAAGAFLIISQTIVGLGVSRFHWGTSAVVCALAICLFLRDSIFINFYSSRKLGYSFRRFLTWVYFRPAVALVCASLLFVGLIKIIPVQGLFPNVAVGVVAFATFALIGYAITPLEIRRNVLVNKLVGKLKRR